MNVFQIHGRAGQDEAAQQGIFLWPGAHLEVTRLEGLPLGHIAAERRPQRRNRLRVANASQSESGLGGVVLVLVPFEPVGQRLDARRVAHPASRSNRRQLGRTAFQRPPLAGHRLELNRRRQRDIQGRSHRSASRLRRRWAEPAGRFEPPASQFAILVARRTRPANPALAPMASLSPDGPDLSSSIV